MDLDSYSMLLVSHLISLKSLIIKLITNDLILEVMAMSNVLGRL